MEKLTEKQKKGLTIGGIVAVIVIAGVALYFNNNGKVDTLDSVKGDATHAVTQAYDSTKDAAAEVPQALSDATTKGDQDTTRPNKDGSTDKLDQK